jgi:hypothetical protein
MASSLLAPFLERAMACQASLASALLVGSKAAFLVNCLYWRIEQGAIAPLICSPPATLTFYSLEKLRLQIAPSCSGLVSQAFVFSALEGLVMRCASTIVFVKQSSVALRGVASLVIV